MKIHPIAFATTFAIALSACNPAPRSAPESAGEAAPADRAQAKPALNAQEAFFERITALCGQSFAGTVTAEEPASTGPDPFSDQPLVMHVRDCSEQQIRIPFHVGNDRSRTWVLTRTDNGLRLKHDHRHKDGSDDVVTMYGGDTASEGRATRQEFPVDAESQAMFTDNDMTVSNTNIWAMEIDPGKSFVYELARPQRLFRVTFDLGTPVATPPAPWGSSD